MNKAQIVDFKKKLDDRGVNLVAVSKTKTSDEILDVYNCGLRDFGENRVQELVSKYSDLPEDIRWHMIGNLQRNKVKHIASFVHMIHSISSASLLKEVQKQAAKKDRVIPILLQLRIAMEGTKQGLEQDELLELTDQINTHEFPNIEFAGIMGMATFTSDEEQLRREFRKIIRAVEKINEAYPHLWSEQPPVLSFGMSGDFEIAIEEGSNLVRIGSLIFGPRH